MQIAQDRRLFGIHSILRDFRFSRRNYDHRLLAYDHVRSGTDVSEKPAASIIKDAQVKKNHRCDSHSQETNKPLLLITGNSPIRNVGIYPPQLVVFSTVIVKLNVAYNTSVLTPFKNSYSHELKAYKQTGCREQTARKIKWPYYR